MKTNEKENFEQCKLILLSTLPSKQRGFHQKHRILGFCKIRIRERFELFFICTGYHFFYVYKNLLYSFYDSFLANNGQQFGAVSQCEMPLFMSLGFIIEGRCSSHCYIQLSTGINILTNFWKRIDLNF